MRKRKYLVPEFLKNFTRSKEWHKFSTITPFALLSDGALWIAEEGDVFWFFDIIGLIQTVNEDINQENFQHWNIYFGPDHAVTINCEDGNNNNIYNRVMPFTYFPFTTLDLYAVNYDDEIKIMLPNEYILP